jgi:hypothetical protein
MRPIPRLLETYEEARLLLEARGWGLAKAAEHLSEMPGLAGFNLSSSSLSRKTAPGSKFPIEPEVASAFQGLETRVGYERQTDIITRGLLALHGEPPIVDVDRLAAELREHLPPNELALKLVEALEEKSGQRLTRLSQKVAERSASELTPKLVEAIEALAPKVVEAVEALEEKASQRAVTFSQALAEKFGRASWKQIIITAGSGALVGCLALILLAPLLPGRARAAAQPGPLVIIMPDAGPEASPVRFEPGILLAMSEWGEKVPADQPIPVKLLPGQKAPPCDSRLSQEAINAGCWIELGRKPPCDPYFRKGDKCYAPVAADPKKPFGPAP